MKGALRGGAHKHVAVPGEQGLVRRVLSGGYGMLLPRRQASAGEGPFLGGWLWPTKGCLE